MLSRLLDSLNDLRPKQLMLLAAATGIILFGFIYLALSFIESSTQEEAERKLAEQARPMEAVVVAASDITPRTIIRAGMLKTEELPLDLIPNDAIRDTKNIVGRPAQTAIFAGDMVTERKLYGTTREAGFVGMIPPNCRAVSIAISKLTSTSGFARPGDKVDVVLIPGNRQGGVVRSEVLLQNVTLLAINDMTDKTGSPRLTVTKNEAAEKDGEEEAKTDKPKSVTTVDTSPIDNPASATLALEPSDAMKLLMAAQTGTIYLVMRPLQPEEMYLPTTEFFFAYTPAVETPKVTTPQVPAVTPPTSMPLPAFQPPTSPVAPPGTNGGRGTSPIGGSYEIIPWGGGGR